MRFTRLKTKSFAAVSECDITFGPGLNVVFGPNEMGKSTLTQAIRAALLLQHTSRLHEDWIPWSGTASPHVELSFETDPGQQWRITKTFASSGRSQLDQSKDGSNWRKVHSGRRVDAEIRKLLRWGLPETGKTRGLPDAFLTAVLLPEQGDTIGLFNRDIAEDKDESGKQLLNEAMQAMSTDPLFKKLLIATGRKYDSAFTATGRRSNAASSPFREINDRIKKAEERRERLQEKKRQAESVESELQRLQEDLSTAIEAFENAETRHKELSASAGELTALREQISSQDSAFAALKKQKSNIDELESKATTAAEKAASLAEESKQAATDLGTASAQVRLLEKQLDDLSNDAIVAKQITEKVTREAELKDARSRLKILRDQQGRADEIQELDTELADLNKQLKELDRQSVMFDNLRKWHQTVVTAKRYEDIGAAASQQRRLEKLRGPLPTKPPTRDEVELVVDLESDIKLAQARCGVELRVRITPERELAVTTQTGSGDPDTRTTGDPIEVTAESQLTIDLADVGRIEVAAGAAEEVERLTQLQTRWDQEARPILARCACEDSTALRAVDESASEMSRQIQALSETLERLGVEESNLDSALATAQTEAREANGVFDDLAAELLADEISLLEKQSIDKRLPAIEGLASESTERMADLRASFSGLQAKHASLVKQFQSDEEAAGLRRDSAAWDEHASELANAVDAQQSRVTALDARLSAMAQSVTSDELQKQLETARTEESKAKDACNSLAASLKDSQSKADQLAGELKADQKAFSGSDFEKAEAALKKLREREADAVAKGAPTKEELSNLANNVELLRNKAETTRSALQQKQGGLKEVGGDIAKEQFSESHQALVALQEQEQQLHLDFDAWKLLLEALRDAEKTQSAHLGQALMEPVAEQVKQLTGNRYGGLALGPSLKTEGVSFAGENRNIDRLSLGTQEQFSTIMRLALARQLKSVLVLDDQLTQSDPDRMGWFRELLHQSADDHQIIVFTCRYADYLLPAEVPESNGMKITDGVTAVDLSQILGAAT
jgi:chromosome segregation ATPase